VRACLLLVVLAGCDLVFSLGADEDGDGTFDDVDGCPHIAEQSADSDQDQIPNDCDLDSNSPVKPDELTAFHGFHELRTDPMITISGDRSEVAGGIVIGSETDPNNQGSRLELTIANAGESHVEIGVTILGLAVPTTEGEFSEVGLFSGNADFDGTAARGHACFLGRFLREGAEISYVETDENAIRGDTRPIDGDIVGRTVRLKQTRFAGNLTCSVKDGNTTSEQQLTQIVAFPGKLVIATSRVRVRIDYIWVAYREATLAITRP
jgi:hypothetical protein